MLDELAGQVPAALSVLPDGASPYSFPVRTTDKPGLISLLDEHGIDAVDFWESPPVAAGRGVLDGGAVPRLDRTSGRVGLPRQHQAETPG